MKEKELTAKEDAEVILHRYYKKSIRDISYDRFLHRRRGGVIVERSNLVLMARPVLLAAQYSEIIEPENYFEPEECDAWYLHLVIGDPALIPLYILNYRDYNFYSYIRGCRIRKNLHIGNVERTIGRFLRAETRSTNKTQ